MLTLTAHSPKKALKAYIKHKPLRADVDVFKTNLTDLLNKITIIENQPKDESEEHLKNNLRDFLRDTFYKDTHAINTKDKKDLVIHLGKTTDSQAGVIIEAKRPTNTSEMITLEDCNKKALHELILYYFDERQANNELKQLIITNVYQWYVFDANDFDKHIYRNTQLKKLYETKLNDKKDNPFFYEEVAKIIAKLDDTIPCIYFNLKAYEDILQNKVEDDSSISALYKLLSPTYLLKIASPNDSNSLNEPFYKELLHVMGLEEVKEGSKNIIRRKKDNRHAASIIEQAIEAIESEDVLHRVKNQSEFGETKDEKIFNIALELCITWINRILFLKLLEGQLVAYHQGDKNYQFLNTEILPDFDELFSLFHKVLAVTMNERSPTLKTKYNRVPYLNSSLFDISELEDQTIKIKDLDNKAELELIGSTVLKDLKKKQAKLPTLNYIFSFLNSYDFGSDSAGELREENKTIINASVLGTVFEKINGYKDGSIYTPAFITMYMCKQSIRLAVIQKFNEVKGWKCSNFNELYDKIDNAKEGNEIINSLKICDPSVGSGHFLVSALNELIVIKSELKILIDKNGKRIKDYTIEIVNDELVIADEDLKVFKYKAQNTLRKEISETQRVQETLFHEKQAIIENCLFGVDINPKSVLICRLRLWIELLKNAYYTAPEYLTLETLPNIDINIKCGNSLISRFSLDSDLSKALKSIKYDIKAYRGFVNDYKNEKNREVKRGLQQIIDKIKTDFKTEINKNSKEYRKLQTLQYEFNLLAAPDIFNNNTVEEPQVQYGSIENAKKSKERLATLQAEINKHTKEFEDIKNNVIYRNAFEWRFEFPEVLNDKGEFEGFDTIIGNPPYIKENEHKSAFNGLKTNECYQGKMDLWYLFGALGLKLLKNNGYLNFIATNNWTTNSGASKFRNIVLKESQFINLTDFGAYMVFDNASIQTMTMLFKKNNVIDNYTFDYRKLNSDKPIHDNALYLLNGKASETSIVLQVPINKENLKDKPLTFNTGINDGLLTKIKARQNFILNSKIEIAQGIVPNPDVVNNNNLIKIPQSKIKKEGIKAGDGVFVVSRDFFLKLSSKEKKYLKPLYEPYLIDRYNISNYDKEIIYFTKKNFKNDAPKLISHLEKFKEIMEDRRENLQGKLSFSNLHWPRDNSFFDKGEKILSVRKCAAPTFVYTNEEAYVMMSFNVIRSERINLKYLTGLLNSKLIAFWLRKKGKMQGNNYQLDKEPLLEIPIYNPTVKEADKISNIVDKIISKKAEGKDTLDLEKEIDELVYRLYNITPEEQLIIETK